MDLTSANTLLWRFPVTDFHMNMLIMSQPVASIQHTQEVLHSKSAHCTACDR